MLFRQLVHPPTSSFSYLLAAEAGGEALLIDPVPAQVDLYLRLLAALDLRLVLTLETHAHDVTGSAARALAHETGCATAMGREGLTPWVTRRLCDGERLEVAGVTLRALHTPGHTSDSYCFVGDDRVFTGDTLLIGGTGRTDLPTGSARQQYESLFGKLLKLPGRLLVYPAHDYGGRCVSTLAEERAENPRLRVRSAAEYEALMERAQPLDPDVMDVPPRAARPATSWSALAALKAW